MNDVVFDPDLITRYSGTGPRYTSYPTAVQFMPDFGAREYSADAQASNRSDRTLSLYVHIPFCKSLCFYCGCTKIVTRNQARVARYLEHLKQEITLQGALYDRRRPVSQLHFGGGTPTYLSREQLDDLFQHIAEHFTLVQDGTQEYSIEVDPRTVDNNSLKHLASHGFNRLSLGVQDFNLDVQKAINRLQSFDSVRLLTEHARHCGFRSVSYDLIYGLPRQTRDSFADTLKQVIALRPDRVAIYNYAHLPDRFKSQRLIETDELPGHREKLDILGSSLAELTAAGYDYIGMDHFALPEDELAQAQKNGTLQRNFQGYSTHGHCDLIGLGVSAISHVGNSYGQNLVNTQDYGEALEAGKLPVARGLRLSDDDLCRADVISDLMCFDEVQFDRFEQRHQQRFGDYFAPEVASLSSLAEDKLVTIDDDAIRVTRRGRMLLRNIAQVFDQYSVVSPGRFSQTI